MAPEFIGERNGQSVEEAGLPAREAAREFLEEGRQRFLSAAGARGVSRMPNGAREVAAVVDGDVPGRSADEDFFDLLVGSDPRYTGVALLVDTTGWVDDQGRIDTAAQPYAAGNGYEVFVFGRRGPSAIDFWRAETPGRFYLYKTLPDDTSERPSPPAAGPPWTPSTSSKTWPGRSPCCSLSQGQWAIPPRRRYYVSRSAGRACADAK